jgi:hypothetical protein
VIIMNASRQNVESDAGALGTKHEENKKKKE